MKVVVLILIFATLLKENFAGIPGKKWTEGDEKIIRGKLQWIMKNTEKAKKNFLENFDKRDGTCGKKSQSDCPYEKNKDWQPGARKFLRLGFHDCLTYKDGAPDGGINGCDGCLNSHMVGVNLMKWKNKFAEGKFTYEELKYTTNNGLLSTADVLEEVYTNNKFPEDATKLAKLDGKSMKEKGYSRADLWAYATMLAVEIGVNNNNDACGENFRDLDGTANGGCGHIRMNEPDCAFEMPRNFTFKFGRRDCDPEAGDNNMGRAFLTNRTEIHPDNQGNGPTTVNFFDNNFGLNAREAIVLMGGAHSVGNLERENSQFKYAWVEGQEGMLNNQQLRNYASLPEKYSFCRKAIKGNDNRNEDTMVWIGNSTGEAGRTGYQIRKKGAIKTDDTADGPYFFFKLYERCETDCTFKDNQNDKCCKNLEKDQACKLSGPKLSCQKWIHKNSEMALVADIGLYRKLTIKANGEPTCDVLEKAKANEEKEQNYIQNCPTEDYAPQGEKLFKIVEDYAKDIDKFIEDFIPALEKMLENGYGDGVLKTE